ncbi:MAG: glycosyltransferase family 4 protein [Nitrospirae bacterium]|nr:glycosyltransferase family 4 protein [Nitrospirota bacterium]
MKIAVAGTRGFPGVQGGVENHCEHLYPYLAKLGCEVTVFTRKPYISDKADQYRGVSLIPLSCPRSKLFEALVHTFRSVLKARRIQPDLMHIHAVGPSLLVPVARALGMKVIITNHGPDYKRKKWSLPAKIFLQLCELVGVVFAHEIIAISGNIADDIRKKYGREATVIPNGVDIPDPADNDEYITKMGLQKGKYILSVGRFVPEKGFDDLLAAFNEGHFKQWKLAIVGDADHEDNYSRQFKLKAGENRNVVLTGFLKGKPLREIYTHAGLFVLPSYYEGLPIVLLEAMSYGLNCIASDIPANKSVELNETGYFKTGDLTALRIKIKEFIDNPVQEREAQLNIIKNKYNWEDIAYKTFQVYNKIITGKSTL